MKKLVIYTENFHDYYFLMVLESLSQSNLNNFNYLIILPESKYNRLISKIHFIIRNSDKNFIFNTYKKIGLILILKILMNYKNKFFILEMYHPITRFFLRFLSNKKNHIFTVHALDNLTSKDKINNVFRKRNINFLTFSEKIQSTLSLHQITNVDIIPGYYPDLEFIKSRKKNKSTKTLKTIFTVTGSVDNRRKDYYAIIDFFYNSRINDFELIFLGKIYDENIKEYAIKKNVKIKFFHEYLHTNIYEKYLLETDYLIGLFSNKKYDSEKLSGIFQDSLRFGIPIITNIKNVGTPFFVLTIIDIQMGSYSVLHEFILNKENNTYAAMKNSIEFDKAKAITIVNKKIIV